MGRRLTAMAAGVTLLGLGACATPASVDGMVVADGSPVAPAQVSPLRESVGIAIVDGGKLTLPFLSSNVSDSAFAEALKRSLAAKGYWSQDAARARYALHATLKRHDRPVRGVRKTVSSVVRYRLQDLEAGGIVFDEKIESRYTVTFDEANIASVRHRRANEGAMRENLKELMTRLDRFQAQRAYN